MPDIKISETKVRLVDIVPEVTIPAFEKVEEVDVDYCLRRKVQLETELAEISRKLSRANAVGVNQATIEATRNSIRVTP